MADAVFCRRCGLRLAFNKKLIELEGPHAATVELSMGAAIGIAKPSKMAEHADFSKHPEVGFVGLAEARRRYPWAERQARGVAKSGVRLDEALGERMLERAVVDVVGDVREI